MKKYLALLLVKAQSQEDFLEIQGIAREILLSEALATKHEKFLRDKELYDVKSLSGYKYEVREEVAKWAKL